MARFTGKTALITGGTSGIGLAAARQLIDEGGHVIVTGRSEDGLNNVRAEFGDRVTTVVSDSGSMSDVHQLADFVAGMDRALDLLVVNAGTAEYALLEDVTEAMYDEMFGINAKGAYFTVQKLLPFIPPGGAIVFVTTIGIDMGIPMSSVYSASKAAMRSMVRSFAAELVGRDIRVNAVSPGPIATPMIYKLGLSEEAIQEVRRVTTADTPMARFGTAEEVARAIVFMGCDATFSTGAEFPVDGGRAQL